MKRYLSVLFFVLFLQVALAADNYKPYLHKAAVPDHPEVKLYGQYHTELFPGAATYSYPIGVPKGVNGLSPAISIFYNSQQMTGRPSVLGAGWAINKDYIVRDANHTVDNLIDDKFILSMSGNIYELVFVNGIYKTEVDYYFRIQNYSDYWIVTTQDGTQHIFGNTTDSKGTNKWFLNSLIDTHGNFIYYSYLQNPNLEDSNSVYLNQIIYGSRKISFTYESSVRPDRRRTYENGILTEESRRLTDISIFVDDSILQRHHFDYSTLNPVMSSISKITYYSSDNTSSLYNITFDYYNSDYGYTNYTAKWTPPALFSNNAHNDYGVRLADLNNDGFIDVVQRIGSGVNKAWLNNKQDNFTETSSFQSPIDIVTSSYVDEGIRFADVNNDGFADLLKSKNGVRSVYLNTGSGWANSSISIPLDFVDVSGNDLGVIEADVNNDGKIDLVQSKDGTRSIYLGTGSGWTNSSFSIPVDFITSSADTGARLVDLNGDSLPDIIQSKNTGSVVQNAWLNNGSGWVNASTTWNAPSGLYFTTTANPDNGVRFADVNGDGLVDILEDIASNGTSTHGAWLNTGNGWSVNNNWQSSEAFTSGGYNIGRRLADLNGDGFTDIIVSHQDSSAQYIWLKNSTLPYQLKSIKNEFGGVTAINYTTSTQYDNTDNGLSQIGFNIYVVAGMNANNSLSDDFNALSFVNYNYSLGKYNYDKAEFRGFGKTTEIKPSAIVNHYFYQDSPRRGKEYRTEILNSTNAMFSAQDNNWNWTQQNGVYNLSLQSSADYLYDGSATPQVTNTTYAYNNFGNYGRIIKHADPNDLADDQIYEYKYAINTNPWILNKVASETIYDYMGNKVKETKYFYDDLGFAGVSKGDLTKTESWNNNGENPMTYFEYDSFGNVIGKTDPLGYTEQYEYDENNIYLSRVTNALGHITNFAYDDFGNKISEEKNGITTSFEYDLFGRIKKEIRPYDSNSLPTKQYYYSFDGIAPESVKVSARTTADNYDSSTFFYDGFSNLLQIKTDIENSQQIVKNIYYDNQFRVKSEDNPYFDTASSSLSTPISSPKTTYTYDATDRVVKVTNPDGTFKKVEFDKYNITDYDENSHKHKYELNALGQIAKVVEYNDDPYTGSANESYETDYFYDTLGNLIGIIDAKNNVFEFTYDSLGRKIGMDDPDMGTWEYTYDINNNLAVQTDNKNNSIILDYDALNRIISKTSYEKNIDFSYDEDYDGTLSGVSTNNISYSYKYDNRLRVLSSTKNLNTQSQKTENIYDSQNRLVSRITDGGNREFYFNKQGKLSKIPEIIDSAYYNPFGSILNKTYSNAIMTSYNYNSETNRLVQINAPNVISLNYSYDSVGNIMSINDGIRNIQTLLKYDSLDRLVEATIGADKYSYSYNELGNMMKLVKNNESKKMAYNGLAHAPSQILSGDASIDLYAPRELNTQSKNRTFELFLVKDSVNITANFSINFGDGNLFESDNLNVSDNGVMAFVQHNYSSGGDYKVNFSNAKDKESVKSKFGIKANKLSLLNQNNSEVLFEFETANDMTETATNVTWNCSDGISSIFAGDLAALQKQYDYIAHNYSSPGRKTFACTVTSNDGSDSLSTDFEVKGLKIENYDALVQDVSKRVISFDAKNYFGLVNANITIDSSIKEANINPNENIMVFSEQNYSEDGSEKINVSLKGHGLIESYIDSFKMTGASIKNYKRMLGDNANRILAFDVKNKWYKGIVNWSVDDPGISESTELDSGETMMVFIENNYSEGKKPINIKTKRSKAENIIADLFEVRKIDMVSFNSLKNNKSSTIFEIEAKNNMDSPNAITWRIDTGEQNITSTETINITNNVLIFVETNYSNNGVKKAFARINATAKNDNETAVVII